jgi:uncharacterized protein YdeI (YjbR/CyaY-like superfamily)
MIETENFEQVAVASAAELRAWLEAHHQQQEAIWLVTWKKHVPGKYVSRDEVLDEILCFGWIDGIRRRLDDDRTMQLLSPRRVQHWAKSYQERAARLIAEGRMHPAGQHTIDTAKASGLWDAQADVDALVMPDDLMAALGAQPPALDNFMNFSVSSRRNVLRWIKSAKTAPTRAKRIAQTAALAARNERVPQMG